MSIRNSLAARFTFRVFVLGVPSLRGPLIESKMSAGGAGVVVIWLFACRAQRSKNSCQNHFPFSRLTALKNRLQRPISAATPFRSQRAFYYQTQYGMVSALYRVALFAESALARVKPVWSTRSTGSRIAFFSCGSIEDSQEPTVTPTCVGRVEGWAVACAAFVASCESHTSN